MPPLPPVPGVLRVEFLGNFDGASWANVMHVAFAGANPTDAQAVTIANDLGVIYHASLMPLTRVNNFLTETIVTDLTSPTSAVGSKTSNVAGSASGAAFTASTSVCISWKIARRYRGGHPRTYMPGIEDTGNASSRNMTDAHVAAWEANAESFRAAIDAYALAGVGPFQFVCVSYRTGHAPRVAPLIESVVGSFVHHRYDSQRRRLGKEPLT